MVRFRRQNRRRGKYLVEDLRAGLIAIGMESEAVPVAGLTLNFSPMPPIEPPPLGRVIEGKAPPEGRADADVELGLSFERVGCEAAANVN